MVMGASAIVHQQHLHGPEVTGHHADVQEPLRLPSGQYGYDESMRTAHAFGGAFVEKSVSRANVTTNVTSAASGSQIQRRRQTSDRDSDALLRSTANASKSSSAKANDPEFADYSDYAATLADGEPHPEENYGENEPEGYFASVVGGASPEQAFSAGEPSLSGGEPGPSEIEFAPPEGEFAPPQGEVAPSEGEVAPPEGAPEPPQEFHFPEESQPQMQQVEPAFPGVAPGSPDAEPEGEHDQIFAAKSILRVASSPCDKEENLDQWLSRSENVSEFVDVWRRRRPGGVIQIDDGEEGCFAEGNMEGPTKKSILNLVHHSPPDICLSEVEMSNQEHFYDVPQHFFNVTGPMAELNAVRSYAAVWPAQCNLRDARCPVVISLQGVNEHATFVRNWYDFQMMSNTGLLNTVQRDPKCMRSLSTVLLFPQLLQGESWVKDGTMLVDHYLVPLTNYFLEKYTGIQEIRRVSIVGFSEGAFGVLTAVTRYPQIFEFGAAIATSLNVTGWSRVLEPWPAETTRPWRLKAIMVAFGEMDASGEIAQNLDNTLGMLESANMHSVPLVVRLYAGLGHNHWENVFNKWPAFHDIIWRGNAGKMD